MSTQIISKRKDPCSTQVYLVWCQSTKMVKIGVSEDAKFRLKKLQNGCGAELLLICTSMDVGRRDAYDLEAKLHDKFSVSRNIGEWFDDCILEHAKILITGY